MSTLQALGQIGSWPVDAVAAAVIRPDDAEPITTDGAVDHEFRLASLSKPMVGWAMMLAVEEGIVELDAPIDADATVATRFRLHPGTTLRHLLAHASGLPFEGAEPVAALAARRIYSNSGIEAAAVVLEGAAEMTVAEYLRLGVFEPLGMSATRLVGSAAHGVRSTVADVARFVHELLRPQLIVQDSANFVESVQYQGLDGIVPGVGKFTPCPWGLGIEIKGSKAHHWMGDANSASTVGHFGGAGTMMWADLEANVGAVALTNRGFDQWAPEALRAWREFSDAVLAEVAG